MCGRYAREFDFDCEAIIICDCNIIIFRNQRKNIWHYIPTPAGIGAVLVTHKNIPSQKDFYYLYNDHLGSLIAATKRGSTVLQEFSYDPWGRRRDAHNWNNYEVTEPTLFTRGFTGHEHIGGYGLINMNGRVYDPRLGRFLSPDPYIQSPFSQSFNRYSYVVNNPLKYIDPDGYRRQYRSRAHPDELPPPQNNLGGGFINNNPNSPYYYPPIGGGFSGFGGGFMNPFSIGGGSWVNSFRGGIRPPGFGENGPGFGGVYYDWYSGTYRSTNGLGQLHWRDAYDVLIAHKENPNGITLPPITYIWNRRRGSGRIVGGVPKWWGDHPARWGSWNAANGGDSWGNTALYYSGKIIGGVSLLNKGRELAEWEYLRQARFNRALSGNFSQPIKHSLRLLKNTGRVLGGAGIVITGVDMGVNGINVSNSLDLVMGGVAFIPGVGWAISGTYFIANITTQLITNKSIGEHIQGQFTDPTASWKSW
jgi:RHS repeat-associated protein